MHFSSVIISFLIYLFSTSVFALGPGKAAIATAHPLATEAGREILKNGGNAFDAAVAITAALAVVEPYGSGLGGGGFWLLHRVRDGKQVMLDGRERAPLLANAKMYLDKEGQAVREKSINGPLSAGIPGIPAGLDYLAKQYGQLPLSISLSPAIRYAKQGFPVTERYRKLIAFRKEVIKQHPAAARIFLKNNEIPELNDTIKQENLAKTLENLVEHGSFDFYQGHMAREMANAVRARGGIWQTLDLQQYRIRERRPITAQYHDMKLTSAAPPSSGGIVLAQVLGILQQFDLSSMSPVQRKHYVVEALRRAYRDRAAYLGDPDFIEIPTRRLLNQEYIDGLAITIDPEQATPSELLGDYRLLQTGRNTTHFSVIDKKGNRVAATLSINLPFGSGYVIPGTGILLNDEMDDFSSKPNTPNAYGLVGDKANSIEPGKRPLSSMSPTFIETADRVGLLGTPGGSRIISMVLLGILDFADGKLPRSWVSVPRYHHQYLPDEIQFEKGGLTIQEQVALKRLGHDLKEKNRQYGNIQAILWHKSSGQLLSASDPRGEGTAIVFEY